ncbi:Gpi16 subunit, GPI transamidase component-domain-containing protein [Mycena sp. CBHHK59/15]|nr:Gpi16 subunit, GPI transamidase component-domain-containing protein [Mycena sp. CBHHK59/15]
MHILREYTVMELYLTLNVGKWDYAQWGYPDELDVAPCAEVWAWMGDGSTPAGAMHNTLAGLFCASFGTLDEQRTTAPTATFAPHSVLPVLPHLMCHGALPSEQVCTENLMPFLKLLPCKARMGTASLLNSHRLFDMDWHGTSLHVQWMPTVVEVHLVFQAVLNPLRSGATTHWLFSTLFNHTITRYCSKPTQAGLPQSCHCPHPTLATCPASTPPVEFAHSPATGESKRAPPPRCKPTHAGPAAIPPPPAPNCSHTSRLTPDPGRPICLPPGHR